MCQVIWSELVGINLKDFLDPVANMPVGLWENNCSNTDFVAQDFAILLAIFIKLPLILDYF
jgi:hypothetical protein